MDVGWEWSVRPLGLILSSVTAVRRTRVIRITRRRSTVAVVISAKKVFTNDNGGGHNKSEGQLEA